MPSTGLCCFQHHTGWKQPKGKRTAPVGTAAAASANSHLPVSLVPPFHPSSSYWPPGVPAMGVPASSPSPTLLRADRGRAAAATHSPCSSQCCMGQGSSQRAQKKQPFITGTRALRTSRQSLDNRGFSFSPPLLSRQSQAPFPSPLTHLLLLWGNPHEAPFSPYLHRRQDQAPKVKEREDSSTGLHNFSPWPC